MRWKTLCCAAIALLVPLPGLARGPHVDLIDYPQPEANWDRAYGLEAALAREFNAICADTWCEGDYSNYRVMEFRCAVLAHRGTVQRCVWVIAASELSVHADSGEVQVDNGRWTCQLALQPGVPVEAFHAALEAPGGLTAPLPGLDHGLFEVLPACLRPLGRAG
ncbi:MULTISPECIES: hypothetical protein [Stenotrophomonas]|jgi:hypothetical protein|nr:MULTISPECIES: hypothetical protein [Stenotrophomonas]MBN5025513.1 hypothetical protein [Stenotrophomonas maltophilia]MDH1274372.1 hypothetical protein [Stenotrophomonas sp. GD03937]MDH1485175.1 hypothetical protein [Stenotrophomonas sp. GD03712]UQY95236.1 hypothetical protein LZ605_19285 [Stenotrophomonas maltophilia]WON68060.1 hypothetical protein RWT08_17885 [Stenotrophomonas maltophilia]